MNNTNSFCNHCVGERNHAILHSETESGTEHEGSYHWSVKNETLKCLGCNTISLRRTTWDSPSTDENGNPLPNVAHFPPAMFRRQPTWVSDLTIIFLFEDDKEFISDLIRELYICIQNDCRRSATMAVRALLEQVMIDKVGDQGTFDENISEFKSKGFISTTQEKFLKTVIEAGHATMHRAFKPSKQDLIALVNIAESVIESAYINEHRAEGLKKRIPPKKPRVPERGRQQQPPTATQ